MPGRLLLAAALALASQAAIGAEPAWTLSCKPAPGSVKLACVVAQQMTVAQTGARLLTVEIVPADAVGNADAALRLSLPHGVRLDAMVGVRVDDGKVYKLPLQTSDAQGLYTTQPLGSDMIGALKKGAQLIVSLVLSDGRFVEVPASLSGFSLAYDAAQRAGSGAQP